MRRLFLTALPLLLAACGNGGGDGGSDVPARVTVALPAQYQNLDTAPGEEEARKCKLCHTIAEGAPHSVGPNLYGVFGRTVGTAPGYAYSEALQAADFVWTPDQLEGWLSDPQGFMPGTRMTFPGVYDESLRHSVIAYLYAETGGGAAAPDADAP